MVCDAQLTNLIDDMPKNKVVELYMVDKNEKAIRASDKGTASSNVVQEFEIAQSLNWDDGFDEFWQHRELTTEKQREKGDPTIDTQGKNGDDEDVKGDGSEQAENEEEIIKDSDYDQDSEQENEHVHENELDNDLFEKHVDNPIEEEPEEMGFAGELGWNNTTNLSNMMLFKCKLILVQ
ncbi:uncharacterized protein [Pyrus communis]|uniref:uncharacterized protein n=1 Tax=Pyrus communis TaxID=23211 RepID=UPI0035C241A1